VTGVPPVGERERGEVGRRVRWAAEYFVGRGGKKEVEGGWAGGLGWERGLGFSFFSFFLEKTFLNSFQIQTFNIFLTQLFTSFHKLLKTFKATTKAYAFNMMLKHLVIF
jgi:hypothetical protein